MVSKGRCPECDATIQGVDYDDDPHMADGLSWFYVSPPENSTSSTGSTSETKIAYVCEACEAIIGFSHARAETSF